MRETYLGDLYLEGGLGVSEMSFVMFDSFISSVEAITTLVAMPVSSLEFLLSLDHTNYITMVTTSKNFQS